MPREDKDWKSPYEMFYSYTTTQEDKEATCWWKKPQLAHLKAYGCRAYAMKEDA